MQRLAGFRHPWAEGVRYRVWNFAPPIGPRSAGRAGADRVPPRSRHSVANRLSVVGSWGCGGKCGHVGLPPWRRRRGP
jgi:hypothetical protein